MADLPSNQSTGITAGSDITITFTETEGGYWDITIASTSGGHTIQDDDSAQTARTNLSFQDGFVVTDDAVGDQTEIDLSYAGTAQIADVAEAEAAGSSITVARGDHVHSGNIYRLEATDHTHQTTGAEAGTLDHGLALTGLTDDDHTQYLQESVLTTKGDIYVATGASTVTRLAVGANDTVLTADSAQATGLKYAAAAGGLSTTLVSGTPGTANTAAAPSETWQLLTADNPVTTVETVMSLTDLAAGTYMFEYFIVWRSGTTTVGIAFAVDFTGTVTRTRATRHYQSTGTTAATGDSDLDRATLTGNLVEWHGTIADNGALGPNTGVFSTTEDQFDHVRGIIVVSTTGNLNLTATGEGDGGVTVMADTALFLRRLA